MIVIKASGGRDVRELRKLARSLSAEPAEISIEDAPPAAPAARRGAKPSVSTLSGARISDETREAIMKLRPVEVEARGEYDFR